MMFIVLKENPKFCKNAKRSNITGRVFKIGDGNPTPFIEETQEYDPILFVSLKSVM